MVRVKRHKRIKIAREEKPQEQNPNRRAESKDQQKMPPGRLGFRRARFRRYTTGLGAHYFRQTLSPLGEQSDIFMIETSAGISVQMLSKLEWLVKR